MAAQTGNQHVQEALLSLKKIPGANSGNGTLTPRDSVQDLPDRGVVADAVMDLAEPGFNTAPQE